MRRLPKEDRAGLYFTVIVHLAVLIVLLASGLGYSLSSENSFVLDFSRQEELEALQAEAERLQAELEFKEAISRKLQEELGGDIPAAPPQTSGSDIRNIAVDRGALRDDRGTDAEQLYADAERLRQELMKGSDIIEEDAMPAPESPSEARDEGKAAEVESYSGPSVVEYDLAGRKASHLNIPAYRCLGGGEVKVIITVNPGGDVIDAKIDESASSTDRCLRNFAIQAATRSRFSAKQGAAPKQIGYIVYQFIAQ